MRSKKLLKLIGILVFFVCAYMVLDTLGVFPTDFSDVDMIYEGGGYERFYYNTLSENGKIAYTLILPKLSEHEEQIEIPKLSEDEISDVVGAIFYDNPEMICIGRQYRTLTLNGKFFFEPTYNHTLTEHTGCTSALESAVGRALSGVKNGMNDYEKELYFHDYICKICSYATDAEQSAGYDCDTDDALVSGTAVCEGYSKAFQLLLNKAGIPNYLVVGSADEEDGSTSNHMWNVVTIGMENYYVDITWDDNDDEPGMDEVCYFYFNVNDDILSKTHHDIIPASNNCTSMKANYYNVNGDMYEYFGPTEKARMSNRICQNVRKSEPKLEMFFTDSEEFDKAVKALKDNREIFDLVDEARKTDRRINYNYAQYYIVADSNYMIINFS